MNINESHNIKEFIVDLEEQGICLYLDNEKLKYKLNSGSLSDDLRAEISEKKQEIIDILKKESSINIDSLTSGTIPLTSVQAAYLAGRTGAVDWGDVGCQGYIEVNYHNQSVSEIVDAWKKLVERHEMLRSKVLATGIETVDFSEITFETAVVDVSNLLDEERNQKLRDIRKEFADLRYDTGKLPLFKTLITKRPDGNYFHLSVDLIIVDFASMQILINELDRLICHEELEPVRIGYSSVARYNDAIRNSIRGIRDRRYWMNRIEAIPCAPQLPRDGRAKAKEDCEEQFSRKQSYISDFVWGNIQRFSADNKVTPSAVLVTLYAYVCSKWSDEKKFTLNLPIQNRSEDEALSGMVGDFTNVNLLEIDLTENKPFVENVKAIMGQLYSDLEHKSFSGVEVLRELSKKRGRDAGFMPYVFTGVLKASSMNGTIEGGFSRTPQVWLDCQVVDVSEMGQPDKGLMISWDIRNGAIKEKIVDDMFDAFVNTLTDIAKSEGDWHKQLLLNVRTSCDYKELSEIEEIQDNMKISLVDGFLYNALKNPDKTAVIDYKGEYSYADMLVKANNIAAYISQNVMKANSRIAAIRMKKSADQIAAALGSIMAGFAYLPIDTKQPEIRINKIIDSARPDIIFDDNNIKEALSFNVAEFSFNKDKLNELAYIIFTSGSTGEPKGVMMSHKAAYNTLVDMRERFGLTSYEKVIGIAELSFDLSVSDVFGTFDLGATLVLTDPEKRSDPSHWAELVKKYGITLWNSVPAQAEMLLNFVDGKESFSSVRNIWLSGDWIRTGLPNDLRKIMPNAGITSLGGATEGGIWSIFHKIGVEEERPSILYGKALSRQWMSVIDNNLEICPDYVTGEIVIGGLSLAMGYLNAKELTDKKFVYLESIGKYIYRTGDKGRFVSDGDIEFLGRIDNQVKVNGHRIELGEIESALNEIPNVKESCVVHYKDMGKEKLAAFVVEDSVKDETFAKVNLPKERVCEETIIKFNRLLECAICESVYKGFCDAVKDDDASFSKEKTYAKEQIKKALGVIEEYDLIFEKWLGILCEKNYITSIGGNYRFEREANTELWEEFKSSEMLNMAPVEVSEYIRHHADNIQALFKKELNPLVFLFPEGDTAIAEKLYGSTAIASYLNPIIAESISLYVSAPGRFISILEVGGGIGATTDKVVENLRNNNIKYDYLFTDLSEFFLTNCKKKYPEMGTAILDMDRIDDENLGTFDVIIAAGVLNNTVNIPGTVEKLSNHLKHGGILFITEPVGEHFEINVSQEFMMPEHTDMRAEGHMCFLERSEWRRILTGAGLDLVSEFPKMESVYTLLDHDLFVAIKTEKPDEKYKEYREFLKERVTDAMVPSIIRRIDFIPVTNNGKIDRKSLIEYAKSLKTVSTDSVDASNGKETDELKLPDIKTAEEIADILKQISGKTTLGFYENLIEEGFDSLLLSQAAGRIVKEIPKAKDIRFDEILRVALAKSTIASIAEYIETSVATEKENEIPVDDTDDLSEDYSVRLVVDKGMAHVIDNLETRAKEKKISCNICDIGNIKKNIASKDKDNTFILSGGDGANKIIEIASELLTQGNSIDRIVLVDPGKPEENTFYLGDIVLACEDEEISGLWKDCVLGEVTECNKDEVLDVLAEDIA